MTLGIIITNTPHLRLSPKKHTKLFIGVEVLKTKKTGTVPICLVEVRIKQRKGIIKNFWRDLKTKYPNPEIFKIRNLALDEDIFLRAISLDEALSHSAVSYNSTKAFLRLEEILAKARPVGRVEPKTDTANQKDFEKLLIMTYEYEDIGRVKLTVGLRRRLKKDEVHQKIEYAITHLAEGVPLMPPKYKRKKKASHKK